MASTFETGVDRRGTACIKWDFQEMDYGRSGLIPFSIADADWPTCQAVLDALKNRVAQGVIGYTDIAPEYLAAGAGASAGITGPLTPTGSYPPGASYQVSVTCWRP